MEDESLFMDREILTDYRSIRKAKTYRERKDFFSELTDSEFIKLHRFDKETALYILDKIYAKIKSPTNRGAAIDPKTKLCAYLRFVAKGFYQEDLAVEYGFAQQSASNIIRQVSNALASLRPQYVNFNLSRQALTQTKQHFYEKWGFPQVIALIDCTHIKIKKPPGEVGDAHRNRKGFFSLNCQVLCDDNFKILDVVCRWRGSAHDSRIWNECAIKKKLEEADLAGGVILGDGGYANSRILLTPFRANYPRNLCDDNYQKKHIAVRGDVEKVFGQLKNKFRVCLSGIQVNLNTAKNIIVSICVLHNIAKQRNNELYGAINDGFIFEEEVQMEQNIHISARDRNSMYRTMFIQKYRHHFT